MDRFIDSVMLGSDRIDERARLITRLCDTVAGVVGDLGPDTDVLVRGALLEAMRRGHGRPLDVVADVVVGLATAMGDDVPAGARALSPGEALALAVCDTRGVTDHALGAVLGIDRDQVAAARDAARQQVGLPPAPPSCCARHVDAAAAAACAACMLVRADATSARAHLADEPILRDGLVLDRVVTRARRWQADMRRPRLHAPTVDGPSPWTAVAGLAV